jgi:preprotein translocase subunit SecF
MSLGLVLLSWALFVGIGPNWGIDFTGGTEIQLRFDEDIAISEVRDALRAIEVSDDAVQEVSDSSTEGSEFVVRIQDAAFGMDALEQDIRGAIGTAFGEDWIATIEQDAEVGARFVVNYSDSVGITTREDMNRAVADLPGISVQSGKEDR